MTCVSLFFVGINLIIALRGDAKETHFDKEGSYYMNIHYIHELKDLKESDFGCFQWNEELWLGNTPLEPILSECGLAVCKQCTSEFSDEFEQKFPKLSRAELKGSIQLYSDSSLAEGNVNGKPYWIQENGNNAIWYKNGVWLIGKEINLGTDKAEIYSASNHVANPYQVVFWKYASSKNGKWIESNDILVWPKTPMVPQAIWPSFVLLR